MKLFASLKGTTSAVFLFFLLINSHTLLWSQTVYTFVNNTVSASNGWDSGNSWSTPLSKAITVSGVPTSGMVLRQVNLFLGDGTTNNDLSSYAGRLKDPLGNTVAIFNSSYFYSGGFDQKYTNIRFRDNSYLKKISDYGSTSYLGVPYYWGYYRVETAGSFNTFNTTTSVNGTWTFEMIENVTTEAKFNQVELVFGPPFIINNISVSKPNQSCATQYCMQTGDILVGTNIGYAAQATYPPLTISGCQWNGQKDNTAWFYFKPSSSTVNLSVSGFTNNVQESVVLKVNTCSNTASDYTLVACPDDNGANGMFKMLNGNGNCNSSGQPTDSKKYYRLCYSSGIKFNHEYNLTGLTVGATYVLMMDGQSGVSSTFYAEVLSGGAQCTDLAHLPVELLYFDTKKEDRQTTLKWATASETNNDYFTIERSSDGVNFEDIARIKASGKTSKLSNYNAVDLNPNYGINYYRLKQTDLDGTFRYSGINSVEYNGTEGFVHNIRPNPTSSNIDFDFYAQSQGLLTIQVIDYTGRVLLTEQQVISEGKSTVNTSMGNLANGIYYLKVLFDKTGYSSISKIIKN